MNFSPKCPPPFKTKALSSNVLGFYELINLRDELIYKEVEEKMMEGGKGRWSVRKMSGRENEGKGEMERKMEQTKKMEPGASARERGTRQPIHREDRHMFFCKAIFHPPIQ